MDKFYHPVRLNESLCKGCINCIKRYPIEAIRVRGGKTSTNNKFCTDRGECIGVCPHHTKHTTYDKMDVMKQYEYTVVLPAPSLYSQLNNLDDINIALNALVCIGFDGMSGVSAAAELVSKVTRQCILDHKEQLLSINTACSSVVRFIRVRFPNLIPHLLPLNPPVEVAAILVAKKAMKDTGFPRGKIGVMFISLCPSKMTYVKVPLGTEKSQVDHVLAIKDVYPKLLACVKVVVAEGHPVIDTSNKTDISWGYSGGEASGLPTENYLAADRMGNAVWVLEDMEDQKFIDLWFVGLNACNGGCVGKALTAESPYVAEAKLRRLRKYMPVARSHIHGSKEYPVERTTGVEYEPVFNLDNNMIESFSKLSQVECLMKEFPGLDYGSCETPTCKVLAKDTVRGNTNEADCACYLRENLHKLSEEVLVLADDLHNGGEGRRETLCILKEYIQRISDEMSLLGKRDEEEEEL